MGTEIDIIHEYGNQLAIICSRPFQKYLANQHTSLPALEWK